MMPINLSNIAILSIRVVLIIAVLLMELAK